MNKIPSVNLADFISGDETKKQKFIKDLEHVRDGDDLYVDMSDGTVVPTFNNSSEIFRPVRYF